MATGPTSSEGKKKVSQNALKHGLRASKWLSAEEQLQFDSLISSLIEEYAPTTATEYLMVERIAMSMIKLRRLQGVEDAMYAKARWETANPIARTGRGLDPGLAVDSSMPSIKVLDTLARYQISLERQISKVIGELRVIKAGAALIAPVPLVCNDDSAPS